MKHIVDMESWERRDNFRFFRDFLNPCFSVTSEVICSAARQRAREKGESFFLHYLYAILRAANEVKELRFRFDEDGRVVWFDTVDVLAPLRAKENGQFFTVRIPWKSDFDAFCAEATAIIRNIPDDGDPYGAERNASADDRYNVILVSATPDLSFTSMTHTQQHRYGNDYPLLNVGKAVERGGELVIPIAMQVNHSFVDGAHVADFYKRVENYLK